MPFYHKLGEIPKKRHTIFKKQDGGLYYEQLFGTVGFDGMSSLLYHTHRPTMVKKINNSFSNLNFQIDKLTEKQEITPE